MHSQTERIFGALENYNIGRPFLWNSEKQGKFNIWNLLVSEGLIYPTNIDIAIKHWQGIESRGTVTAQDAKSKGYQYAPCWKERKDKIDPYLFKQRVDLYKALAYFIKQNLQNIEAYVLRDYGYTEYDFRTYIILGQTLDLDWICLMPTVPDQIHLRHPRSVNVNFTSLSSYQSEHLNTRDLFEKVNKILARLTPLSIYGYYDYTYKHRIFCTTSSNKTEAIKLGLKANGIFGFENSLSEIIKYSQGEQARQFMQKALQGCRCYTFNFWVSAHAYYLGSIPNGDWLGFNIWHYHEYNP